MTDTKHTPLPWVLESGIDGQLIIWAGSAIQERETGVYDSAGEMQLYDFPEPSEECHANAEFIVRACNAHYELLGCLETLHARAKGKSLDCNAQALYNRCTAAIAKARGEA